MASSTLCFKVSTSPSQEPSKNMQVLNQCMPLTNYKTLKSEGDPNLPEEDARVYGLQMLAWLWLHRSPVLCQYHRASVSIPILLAWKNKLNQKTDRATHATSTWALCAPWTPEWDTFHNCGQKRWSHISAESWTLTVWRKVGIFVSGDRGILKSFQLNPILHL